MRGWLWPPRDGESRVIEKPMPNQPFRIIMLSDSEHERSEPMGSKENDWFLRPDSQLWLYKQRREGTGEDWAEKCASHLCDYLGLPHAVVELAGWRVTQGIATLNFVPKGADLVHGNEKLAVLDPGYPGHGSGTRRFLRTPQHTIRRVFEALSVDPVDPPPGWNPPSGIRSGADVFVGYLLLDAWIGNTDRHHGNWGFLSIPEEGSSRLCLAPTFDHASSLGRNESDEKRAMRLTKKDQGFSVHAYAVEKCRSALYDSEGDRKPLTTIDAFGRGANIVPAAALVWLAQLAAISEGDIRELFGRIPPERISAPAADFAMSMLAVTANALKELAEQLR